MNKNKVLSLLAGVTAMVSVANASEFGDAPEQYGEVVELYVKDRLHDPRAARVKIMSEPYKVYASIGAHNDMAVWAVDIRVRARMPDGGFGGYVPHTVLLMDGEPIAFREDVEEFSPA